MGRLYTLRENSVGYFYDLIYETTKVFGFWKKKSDGKIVSAMISAVYGVYDKKNNVWSEAKLIVPLIFDGK